MYIFIALLFIFTNFFDFHFITLLMITFTNFFEFAILLMYILITLLMIDFY